MAASTPNNEKRQLIDVCARETVLDKSQMGDAKAYSRWADEEDAELARLIKLGTSPDIIAKQLRRNVQAVCNRAHKTGSVLDVLRLFQLLAVQLVSLHRCGPLWMKSKAPSDC